MRNGCLFCRAARRPAPCVQGRVLCHRCRASRRGFPRGPGRRAPGSQGHTAPPEDGKGTTLDRKPQTRRWRCTLRHTRTRGHRRWRRLGLGGTWPWAHCYTPILSSGRWTCKDFSPVTGSFGGCAISLILRIPTPPPGLSSSPAHPWRCCCPQKGRERALTLGLSWPLARKLSREGAWRRSKSVPRVYRI